VLSGPSLASMDLSQPSRRGIVTMGVNNSWAVHRPTLWTCVDCPDRFIDIGWKDPGILKLVPVAHWNRRLRVALGDGKFRASQFRVREMPSGINVVGSTLGRHRPATRDWTGTDRPRGPCGIGQARTDLRHPPHAPTGQKADNLRSADSAR
jgi:hypothetical protein